MGRALVRDNHTRLYQESHLLAAHACLISDTSRTRAKITYACLAHEVISIHTFNKSERLLEFSKNDVIREKIIHEAKMATKAESSVEVNFAACSWKKECFYLIYIKRNISFMSLWVCHRNFKAFVQRYSWINDIEGKRELI